MTQSKAPAGSSILQLSPGPVLKHQLIPQHWFRASQTGGRKGGRSSKGRGKTGRGPAGVSFAPSWVPSLPQNQPVLCSSRAAGRGTMAPSRAWQGLEPNSGSATEGSCSRTSPCPGSEPSKRWASPPREHLPISAGTSSVCAQALPSCLPQVQMPDSGTRPPKSKSFRAVGWLPPNLALQPPATASLWLPGPGKAVSREVSACLKTCCLWLAVSSLMQDLPTLSPVPKAAWPPAAWVLQMPSGHLRVARDAKKWRKGKKNAFGASF